MSLNEWLLIVIPAGISIIGFSLTIFLTTRSVKTEIKKQKTTLALDEMVKIPSKILDIFNSMVIKGKKNIPELTESLSKIYSTIFAYGSIESIRVVSALQQEGYLSEKGQIEKNAYRILSLYILLVTQIKYDVTGVYVSPSYYFKMKMSDYDTTKEEYSSAVKSLVKELELSNYFNF